MPDTSSNTDFWLQDKINLTDSEDAAIIIYMAQRIVEHGGYFCATQIRTDRRRLFLFSGLVRFQYPSGEKKKTCFWLCEPGYSGEGCEPGTITSSSDCAYTMLNQENLSRFVSYNESESPDNSNMEMLMEQNNSQGIFRITPNVIYTIYTILAAKEYLDNGHGIIASPAIILPHYLTDPTDIFITDTNANYTTKTLCMPGFDGPGCSTSICTLCEDRLSKYNPDTGYCSDCIENHIHDSTGACIPCPDGAYRHPDREECIKCDNTEYFDFDDGECKPKTKISHEAMAECWPNSDTSDFQACAFETCESGKTVECATDDNRIGKKTCINKKWSKCKFGGIPTVQTAKPVLKYKRIQTPKWVNSLLRN